MILRRPDLPVHLLRGEHAVTDAALSVLPWALWGLKLLALPVAVAAWAPRGAWAMAIPATLGAALVLRLGRDGPRSCAAPLRDDAVFVGAMALLSAASPVPLQLGVAAGLAGTIGLLLVIGLCWGRRGRFTWMRRPGFRVMADNPGSLTALGRVRAPCRLVVPRMAEGPVTVAVYDLRYACVAEVGWARLAPVLRKKPEVALLLGASEPGSADLALPLAPGRYLVSVRQYRPHARSLPHAEVVS